MTLSQRIHAAADFLSARIPERPSIGLILGSGLGDYADTLSDRIVIPFSDIPDFPQATVEGHVGAFVFGSCQGKYVVALQGRLHYYEGHSMQELTLPVRIMALLGVKQLVLTNAAGGVNYNFRPGDLMLITDHINYSGANPLIGVNMPEFGPRFPDVTDLYSKALREKIRLEAARQGIVLQQGVYMMFSGPNYETPAEVRMARIVGADAVGMSTVPEALVAAQCGIGVLGISCITNMAAGVTGEKLSHQEVMDIAAQVHDTFHSLVDLILALL
ncbi:MAG: purine-nucleoside phosphorylase [Oscillospiraceae bacterium]|nr:purine-nucleoside phosphorylase [Oscillospiraceae bacterium]